MSLLFGEKATILQDTDIFADLLSNFLFSGTFVNIKGIFVFLAHFMARSIIEIRFFHG